MQYFYDKFETHIWQYIKDTHSDSVKIEVLIDIPPAEEFRIHITHFQPGAGAEPHTHEWEHAMYIMQGTAKVNIDDQESILKKGMLAFVPKNKTHSIYNIGDEELIVWGVSGPPKTEVGFTQLKRR